jgi:hypothetical protein
MRKRDEFIRSVDRLATAVTLFVVQQWGRIALGDEDEYEDSKQETEHVVDEVVKAIRMSLDEDLVERLDNDDYPWLAFSSFRLADWRRYWPYYYYCYPGWARYYAERKRRRDDMLYQILNDFRADFGARLRRARRDDLEITDEDLDAMLRDLKRDLAVVARRSRHREERRERHGDRDR